MSPLHQDLTIAGGLEELPRVTEMVDRFCERIAASEQDTHALHLAVEEIVSNVIRHGYQGAPHPVRLSLVFTAPDRVSAVVTDQAPAYDPLSRPEVDTTLPLEERPIGGLGVHLVKQLMHATRYERRDGENVLTMELVLGKSLDSSNSTA